MKALGEQGQKTGKVKREGKVKQLLQPLVLSSSSTARPKTQYIIL